MTEGLKIKTQVLKEKREMIIRNSLIMLDQNTSSRKHNATLHQHPSSSKSPNVLLKKWPATLLKTKLWYRCFSVNFAKLFRGPFLQNISGQLLLNSTTDKTSKDVISTSYQPILPKTIINVTSLMKKLTFLIKTKMMIT